MEVESIVEERSEATMVSSSNGGKPVVRIAKFLKPTANSVSEAEQVPIIPRPNSWQNKVGVAETPSNNVLFKGWRNPQNNWSDWIERMVPLYENTWKQLGIHDSVMSSKYKICTDQELVLGLSEFWCPETNTFVFSWGEATITLEDMLVLGGYSALGISVSTPLSPELEEMEKKLIAEHSRFNKTKTKKASYSAWISRFMEKTCSDVELEHIAFLALWLSRFVFTAHPENSIGKHVFPVAIHLAHGKAIALGPAVLTSIYRDLRLLKENSAAAAASSEKSISVWGPLQLVQMWALEHFLPLKRIKPIPLALKEPRAARWNNARSESKLQVTSSLNLEEIFWWRPYAISVNNWNLPAFYKERDELLESEDEDRELLSFPRFLKPCMLVGLDSTKEKYSPHRVARQFGYDQDLPGIVSQDTSYESHWQSCDKHIKNAKSFVRSRFLESSVTPRYQEWWKTTMFTGKSPVNDTLEQQGGSVKNCKRARQDSISSLPQEDASDDDSLPLTSVFKRRAVVQDKKSDIDESINTEEHLNDEEIPLSIRYYSDSEKVESSKSSTKKKVHRRVSTIKCNKSPETVEARIDRLEKLVHEFSQKLDS